MKLMDAVIASSLKVATRVDTTLKSRKRLFVAFTVKTGQVLITNGTELKPISAADEKARNWSPFPEQRWPFETRRGTSSWTKGDQKS